MGMIGEREGQRGEGERMRGTGSSHTLRVIKVEENTDPKAADLFLLF